MTFKREQADREASLIWRGSFVESAVTVTAVVVPLPRPPTDQLRGRLSLPSLETVTDPVEPGFELPDRRSTTVSAESNGADGVVEVVVVVVVVVVAVVVVVVVVLAATTAAAAAATTSARRWGRRGHARKAPMRAYRSRAQPDRPSARSPTTDEARRGAAVERVPGAIARVAAADVHTWFGAPPSTRSMFPSAAPPPPRSTVPGWQVAVATFTLDPAVGLSATSVRATVVVNGEASTSQITNAVV